MRPRFQITAVVLLALTVAECSRPQARAALALTGVTVIDVRDGTRVTDATVLIEDGRITSLGPGGDARIPSYASSVDMRGKYVLPGLWDVHTHIQNARELETFFPLLIAHGVLQIRDMGGDFGGNEGLSPAQFRSLGAKQPYQPHVVACGPNIDGPALAHATATQIVDREADEGFDCIKVLSMLPRDGFLQVIARARQRGLPVVGHLPIAVRAAEASDAGLRTLEHLGDILLNTSTRETELRAERVATLSQKLSPAELESVLAFPPTEPLISAWNDAKAAMLFEKFVANHTWQTPTLISHEARLRAFRNDASFWNDPDLQFMPKDWVDAWRPEHNQFLEGLPPSTIPEYLRRMEATHHAKIDLVRRMHDAGVGFLAGTDVSNWNFTVPGPSLHSELHWLTEAGLTPLEALRTATLNAARYLDMEKTTGTVEVGKRGDLLVLDADPTEKIANTRRIFAVILNGQLIGRDELDRMLERARKRAADVPRQ